MLKFMLNLQKFNNYAFFCPVSRLHLTVSSPVGYTNEVTPAILKAIKSKTIIDVEGRIDLEAGTAKEKKADSPVEQPETQSPEVPEPETQEKSEEQPKTTGRKNSKKAKEVAE